MNNWTSTEIVVWLIASGVITVLSVVGVGVLFDRHFGSSANRYQHTPEDIADEQYRSYLDSVGYFDRDEIDFFCSPSFKTVCNTYTIRSQHN